MNDAVTEHIAKLRTPRFAYNLYAHFLVRFGTSIMGVRVERYRAVILGYTDSVGRTGDALTEYDLRTIVNGIKNVCRVPQDPMEQLTIAVCRCFDEWYAPNAVSFREEVLGTSSDRGTAIVVQSMVFGSVGSAFSRDPLTGAKPEAGQVFGSYW